MGRTSRLLGLRPSMLGALALTTLALVPTAPAAGRQGLDHEAFARAWLERNGYAGERPAFQKLLEERFVHLRLGRLELRVDPSALKDEGQAEELGEALGALVSLQESWLGWLSPDAGKAVASDAKTLRSWIERWKPRDLTASTAGASLVEALSPKEKIGTAAASFAAALGERSPGGTAPARLVLVPDRRRFLELACVAGLVHPELQGVYWAPSLVDWTYFDHEGTRIVAFQFHAQDPTDPTRGLGMNSRNPLGLEQQVVQLASRALLEATYGEALDPMLAGGLANNLVIDLYGEVDTRTDGDLSSRKTDARSIFVPGAHAKGGTLPPVNADSPWRAERGRDHFLGVLREAQKAGAKELGKRGAARGFLIRADGGTSQAVLRAPFLGKEAIHSVDSVLEGPFAEFLRAYRAAFLHFLREGGKDWDERFAELLGGMAAGGGDFLAEAERVYGMPLSSVEAGEDTLEGRFLDWLGKRR